MHVLAQLSVETVARKSDRLAAWLWRAWVDNRSLIKVKEKQEKVGKPRRVISQVQHFHATETEQRLAFA